jgi:uncharacterized protein
MIDSELLKFLNLGSLPKRKFSVPQISCRTEYVAMRDGVKLATDLYLPPEFPAPVVVSRSPYDRSREDRGFTAALISFARRGYAVVSQDCRGTGESEPDTWDYYMYESEDGYDCIEWLHKQDWCNGFIGSIGGSYAGQTQWCMALHPAMSATVPSVSGLGVGTNTAHLHMLVNAYARTVGKGANKIAVPYNEMERLMLDETLSTGYFNEPLQPPLSAQMFVRYPELRGLPSHEARRRLWERYCRMSGAERAKFVRMAFGVDAVTINEVEGLSALFGKHISHDRLTIPEADPARLAGMIHAPPLIRTGWYDWALNDALDTFRLMRKAGKPDVAARTRMLITPYAHAMPGYREGWERHPELLRMPTVMDQLGYTVRWYEAVQQGKVESWPAVIYYLMGANEWRAAEDWPPPGAKEVSLYLGAEGTLTMEPPAVQSVSDGYTYDPKDPTPTVGGSIVSFVYPTGSVDVSEAQQRDDVLVYTTPPLERDLEIVGPLTMVLYASSSAVDTDFVARLSDVFPDGRALQLQSGILRARYRDLTKEPELIEPGRVYRFEIDLWATANRFKAGHRLRVDISSADFPHFDRNANRGGRPGEPVPARQMIFRDREHPSHLVAWSL